jgi:hypothetical protein
MSGSAAATTEDAYSRVSESLSVVRSHVEATGEPLPHDMTRELLLAVSAWLNEVSDRLETLEKVA